MSEFVELVLFLGKSYKMFGELILALFNLDFVSDTTYFLVGYFITALVFFLVFYFNSWDMRIYTLIGAACFFIGVISSIMSD